MPGSTAGSDRASATEVAGVETPGVSGVEALSRAQRYLPQRPDDEVQLRTRIIELARAYGQYGYKRITPLLHAEGWRVNRGD